MYWFILYNVTNVAVFVSTFSCSSHAQVSRKLLKKRCVFNIWMVSICCIAGKKGHKGRGKQFSNPEEIDRQMRVQREMVSTRALAMDVELLSSEIMCDFMFMLTGRKCWCRKRGFFQFWRRKQQWWGDRREYCSQNTWFSKLIVGAN